MPRSGALRSFREVDIATISRVERDCDRGRVLGAATRRARWRWADLIGLDTTKAVMESLYEEFTEPLYAAPPLLARMGDGGLLGRKTGRGLYSYG